VGSFGRRIHDQRRAVRHKSLDHVFQEPVKRYHSTQAAMATHCNKLQQSLLDVEMRTCFRTKVTLQYISVCAREKERFRANSHMDVGRQVTLTCISVCVFGWKRRVPIRTWISADKLRWRVSKGHSLCACARAHAFACACSRVRVRVRARARVHARARARVLALCVCACVCVCESCQYKNI